MAQRLILLATMKQNRVLITGANGLLGKNLVTRLLNYGYEVFGLVRENTAFVALENYHEIELDLLSDFDSDKLPIEINTIVHLAQSPEFKNFPSSANNVFAVNTFSTMKLLDYARKTDVNKFIYASSGAVYEATDELISKNSNLIEVGSPNFYAITKLASEYLVGAYKDLMATSILRFFFIYGPGQDSRMLFPTLALKLKNGESITLNGPEGIRINPIHVLDAAKRVHEFIESDMPGTFNVSGRESVTIKDICELMSTELEVNPTYEVKNEAKNVEVKITDDLFLNSSEELSLREGVRHFLNDYKY